MFVDLCRCKSLLTWVTRIFDVRRRVSTTCCMSVPLYIMLIVCTHVLIPNILLFVLFFECSARVGSRDPSSYSLRWQRGRFWNDASVFGDLCRCTSESLLTHVEYWWCACVFLLSLRGFKVGPNWFEESWGGFSRLVTESVCETPIINDLAVCYGRENHEQPHQRRRESRDRACLPVGGRGLFRQTLAQAESIWIHHVWHNFQTSYHCSNQVLLPCIR